MDYSDTDLRKFEDAPSGKGRPDSVMDSYAYQAVWGEGVELLGPRHHYRETLLLRKIRGRMKGGRILDAGSGCGTLAVRLAEAGYDVTSVESTDGSYEHVMAKVKNASFKDRCTFQKGSITSLPVEDEQFQAVVAGEVLEHYENEKEVIDEFYRVLVPGGCCVVSVPAHKGLWGIDDELAGHFRRYTRKGLQDLFENAGFRTEEVTCWGFPVTRSFRRLVLYPYIKRKLKASPGERGIRPVLGQIARRIGPPASLLFQLDGMFNWTNLGIGFIAVFTRT